jgi:hypothetical protein
LGNIFVVVGNAELSNNMASYAMNKKMFVIKTFFTSAAVWRQYHQVLSVSVAPLSDTIYLIVKQYEETENMCDKHAKERECIGSYGRSRCSTRGNNKKSTKKRATHSTND